MVRIFIRMLRMLPNIIQYYPSSFTTTLHHFLLHFIIHYYHSSFTTTLHHSLLPFIIPTTLQHSVPTLHHSLLPSSFPTTLHHTTLLPFIIPYYPSSFTTTTSSFATTIHYSLLPYNIPYYPSLFTTTIHHSLLPFIIHSFIIHYYPSSFTTTLHHSLLPFIIPCYCLVYCLDWKVAMLPASALFFPSLSSFPQPLSSVSSALPRQLNVQHWGKKGGY